MSTKSYLPLAALSIVSSLVIISLPAMAEEAKLSPTGPWTARHVVGVEHLKHNGKTELSVQQGAMQCKFGKSVVNIPTKSIEDVYNGNEVTQAGGTTASLAKMAVPYGGGRALSLLLKTKIDVLTVTYRDENGGFHGVVLALPKGAGDLVRSQLVAQGAHASPVVISTEPAKQESK